MSQAAEDDAEAELAAFEAMLGGFPPAVQGVLRSIRRDMFDAHREAMAIERAEMRRIMLSAAADAADAAGLERRAIVAYLDAWIRDMSSRDIAAEDGLLALLAALPRQIESGVHQGCE